MSKEDKGDKAMKKLLMILLVMLFIVPSVMAKEVTLTFAWDANSEPDMASYALFHRTEGQQYDYSNPLDPNCTIVDGFCYIDPVAKTCEFEYSFDSSDGEITTHYFVARAKDTEGKWSGDSNEVSQTFDFAPIGASTITAAVWNETTNTIDIAFTQADSERVEKWELFMSNTSGSGYNKVDTIVKEGTGDTFSASWQIPSDGDYYFTLVSFTPEGMFSNNSNEMYVQVKTHPSPIKDFKIKIRLK